MILLHHLHIGRSIFMVWQLEEFGLEYELKHYYRDPETFRAPAELKNAHPLGKSPVIEDDGMVISESSAITTYLLEKYDQDHKLSPPRSELRQWVEFTQWLHYPEGSVFTPLLVRLLLSRANEPNPIFTPFSEREIDLHFSHIATKLGDNEFILGDSFSAADFGISYVLNMGKRLAALDKFPTLSAYIERNMARPAFLRAIEKGVE